MNEKFSILINISQKWDFNKTPDTLHSKDRENPLPLYVRTCTSSSPHTNKQTAGP